MKSTSSLVPRVPTLGLAARLRRARAPLAVLTALVLTLLAVPAHAEDDAARAPSTPSSLSYRESGCTEIAYIRGGLASAVRPLVPERFALADFPGLPEGSPPRVYLGVNEVTCDRGRFPGSAHEQRHYTYLIVSAWVTATEGDQRDGVYVLYYATENKAQRAALRRLGWPVTSLSRRTEAQLTHDASGTPVGSALHVVGGGWDHEVAAVTSAPTASAEPSSAEYYRDTVNGPQTTCFANLASVTAATYSGDLRGTPLATVAYVPPVYNGYPGYLVVGGWSATVTAGHCPSSSARARTVLTQVSPTTGGAARRTGEELQPSR